MIIKSSRKYCLTNYLRTSFSRQFSTQQKYEDCSQIHPILRKSLQHNDYKNLTKIQEQIVNFKEGAVFSNDSEVKGKTLYLGSGTGTGKTLAYLLPILNTLFEQKYGHTLEYRDQNIVKINAKNQDDMFKNVFDESTKIRNKAIQTVNGEPRGAIIIVNSKNLINQIYCEARRLDICNNLNITRATSDLQMKTPIVELITPNKEDGEGHSEAELFKMSMTNVINNADWQLNDIFIATPIVMNHILDVYGKYAPYNINPKYVVIDELDEIMANPNTIQPLQRVLDRFSLENAFKNTSEFTMHYQSQRLFMLSASTLPQIMPKTKVYNSLTHIKEHLFKNSRHLVQLIDHNSYHLLNPKNCPKFNQIDWIDFDELLQHRLQQTEEEEGLSNKKLSQQAQDSLLVEYLWSIVQHSFQEDRHRQIVVYFDNMDRLDKAHKVIIERNKEILLKANDHHSEDEQGMVTESEEEEEEIAIKAVKYCSELGISGRTIALQQFTSVSEVVLLSTGVGARGLDFKEVDHVILFDFPRDIQEFYHKVGRTGRNGQQGKITSFYRKKDQTLVNKIKNAMRNQTDLSNLMTRKIPQAQQQQQQ